MSGQQRITTDKRLRFTSPKLPSATSFIRNTLGDIAKNTIMKGDINNV